MVNRAMGKINVLKIERPRLHILVWCIFIIYDRACINYARGKMDNPLNYVTYYGLNICLFYFNAHVLMPVATAAKKYRTVLVALSVLGQVTVYIILRFLLYYFLNLFKIVPYPAFAGRVNYLVLAVLKYAYYFTLSIGYWFALSAYYHTKKIANLEQEQLRSEIQTETLEKNLLVTENARLKAQINPHFLLNTLNFLYNSVSKYSEQVADSFLTLADIMRYSLTNIGEDDKVRLEDELDNILNFIKLNQARFNQRLQVDFEIEGDQDGLRVPPLILMTLVENVFKYGDLLNAGHPAKIIAHIDGNKLTFVTQNLKRKNVLARSHGIGLQNTKSRLAAFEYSFAVEEDDQSYSSTLKIQL